jgi:hypothetical protein
MGEAWMEIANELLGLFVVNVETDRCMRFIVGNIL